MFPRKLNGTTTRLTLSDSMQGRCPWWGFRKPDNKIVMSLRSLCICEDTVNDNGLGHVALCGCNEPGRNQFIWSPDHNQIISPRTDGPNRCLRINADYAGEEIIVVDCRHDEAAQQWTTLTGRYRNYWYGRHTNNNYYYAMAVRTRLSNEADGYRINSDWVSKKALYSPSFDYSFSFISRSMVTADCTTRFQGTIHFQPMIVTMTARGWRI